MASEEAAPKPSDDWQTQNELAELLGISERTASIRASAGELRIYEHGVRGCGRRKYSRALVQRELDQRWTEAVDRLTSSSGDLDNPN